MRGRGGLVPQKVAIGPRLAEAPVGLPVALADGKGYGGIGEGRFDAPDDRRQLLVGETGVFAPLQDEGAEPERVAAFTAGEDLPRFQPVALRPEVARPDAAVEAVVPAVVRKFDQPPDEDGVAVHPFPDAHGAVEEFAPPFRGRMAEKLEESLARERALAFEAFDQWIRHGGLSAPRGKTKRKRP